MNLPQIRTVTWQRLHILISSVRSNCSSSLPSISPSSSSTSSLVKPCQTQLPSPDVQVDCCTVDPCQPEPSIVIIGAGIAGLSAAQRLVQCGIKNFTVLEATDRPGGRIQSCWLGDVVAEMGAQWIEGGCIGNPIYTLAAQEGLLKPPLSRPDNSNILFCTSDGRAIDHTISVMACQTFAIIKQEAESLFNAGCGDSHGSLYNFMAVRIDQELHNFPEEHRYDAARVLYGMANVIRCSCGDDLSLISANHFGSQIRIPGGSVCVPLGYVGVLAPLLRELPQCSVHYCKPVSNIRWGTAGTSGPRALVRCCDGDEFPADYVLITVSLGVLKKQADSMFCPTLPCEKMDAINKLGFGKVNKIFLEYRRPFWVWREGSIRLAWSSDELANRNDWVKGLCRLEEMEGSQHVICAWVAGAEASRMESCSEEEVAEECTRILRRFTGDPSLPFPTSLLRSKWCSNPYFCGSYSYMGMESTIGHQCDLGTPVPGTCDPVPPILLFAGEATCSGHYATVHGARLSGIREAERIIQLTKRYGGPPKLPQVMPC